MSPLISGPYTRRPVRRARPVPAGFLRAFAVRSSATRDFTFATEVTADPAWQDARQAIRRSHRAAPWFGPFVDARTQDRVFVRPAKCAASGCACAAEWKEARDGEAS